MADSHVAAARFGMGRLSALQGHLDAVRPGHLIITMIKKIRTSRLSIKNSLCSARFGMGCLSALQGHLDAVSRLCVS